jgi:hypothetical protein
MSDQYSVIHEKILALDQEIEQGLKMLSMIDDAVVTGGSKKNAIKILQCKVVDLRLKRDQLLKIVMTGLTK